MNKKFSNLYAFASILAGISASLMPITASADWMITGLGTLGREYSHATGINDSGQVVGYSNNGPADPVRHAFITGSNGVGMTDLGTLGGQFSDAYDVNNLGQVVGYSTTGPSWVYHAFITGPNGVGMTDLGTLAGLSGGGSNAFSINDSGQVVGYSTTEHLEHGHGSRHAFITGPNGVGMTDLGTLGRRSSYANDINNLGQVVGTNAEPGEHAFITGPNGVGMMELGSFGGSNSVPLGINDFGQVVGYSTDPNGVSHAFITGLNGVGMTALGNWAGESLATDINNQGQVIGRFIAEDGLLHAFLYSEGLITDLSLLPSVVSAGWTELNLQAINNNGQIVGSGSLNSVGSQAFLLSYLDAPAEVVPVPEPGTILLMGLGLLCFNARRIDRSRLIV